MADIRFYHMQKQNLDQALPLILEKAYQADHKVVVRMENAKEVERMNALLWTYKPDVFLPHGSKKEGHAALQPIWLTDKEENPNNANVLVLTQGVQAEQIDGFSLCCEMLDGHNEGAVSAARKRWKAYQEAGHDVTYWHQSETGKWEKKA
ncbi:MAG TPA: DNA polymerase III subunit chi [Alphaproteobacteria bacterium]|nr:DNA polymerase III subunit chi [Alphaproteobacteria bacterium]